MVEKKLMSFKTQRVLEKIVDKEFVDVNVIQEVFEGDPYLPKNRSDAFSTLSFLNAQKYLVRVKRGLYKVQSKFIKQELGGLQ
jgi:hypothetical protein